MLSRHLSGPWDIYNDGRGIYSAWLTLLKGGGGIKEYVEKFNLVQKIHPLNDGPLIV